MAQSTGIGKVTFGGVDLTNAPYYAHLTTDANYWFMDGQVSQQFPTGAESLVSTQPIFTSYPIHAIFRIEPPDGTRTSMLYALTQLTSVLDPSLGEQMLTFAEYSGSYFMAKKLTSTPQNEAAIPYMMELAVDFGCTGPAYTYNESVQTIGVLTGTTEYTLTTNGDTNALPRWRFTSSGAYLGPVSWVNNTTNQTFTWYGSLTTGDVLDVITDEYGIPHTVLINGNPNSAGVVAPSWPYLTPGDNDILFSGPSSGTLETRWRDRYLVGLQ
jgi:hypothetical protein